MGLFYMIMPIVASATVAIHKLVTGVVSEPYMDEIFHVPQAQAYCAGNLTQWDPKITTLPGLYLLSAGALTPLGMLGVGCDVANLRFINVILNWLNLVVIYKICAIKFKDETEVNRTLMALSIGLTPLLFFFSFLYYTDPGSTLAVLVMHYLSLKRRYVLSALMGIVATVMRQTNIVWLCWTASNVVWEHGERTFLRLLQPLVAMPKKGRKVAKKSSNKKKKNEQQQGEDEVTYSPIPLLDFDELILAARTVAKDVIPKAYMYVVVFGLFVAFIITNGGIVVGDKEAHQATINIPQIFYFSLFSMVMGFATVMKALPQMFETVRQNKVTFVFSIIAALVIVHVNTIAHPYLLADNRHYTFYLWKRLYETRPILRYLLVPAYITFGFFLCTNLDLHPPLIFTFIVLVTINSIPQRLLEFRYFLLSYIFLRLHMKASPSYVLAVELLWAIVLNALTIHKFLYSPFTWAHAPEQTQRFMW